MAALLGGMPSSALAQKYDFSKVDWKQMVEVFHEALANGKNVPTDEELTKLGISKTDLAFIKSHVKPRSLVSPDSRLLQDTYATRKLWMNTPMGSGSGGSAGYPSAVFHSDVFSLWNYTALWGAWNHGIGQVPGSWTDAAHKNGAFMQGGTVFFDSGSTTAHKEWLRYAGTKGTSSVAYNGFEYVRPMIHMLKFFGFDGININWEVGSPSYAANFHQALYDYAKSIGFNDFRLTIYTTSSSLSSWSAEGWYNNGDKLCGDVMLNYGGEGSLSYSVDYAKGKVPSVGGDAVWQGFWIEKMNHGWSRLNTGSAKEGNICLWGEHKDSRFWSYNSGAGSMEQQANYQSFLERAFSGGKKNPLQRPAINDSYNEMEWDGLTPPLSTFAGFSTWIPERSTVTGNLPFATNFNLGNGTGYYYRGKAAAGSWYNMAAQDIVPTYRWLVLAKDQKVDKDAQVSTAIAPAFTHEDAFMGGSCLQLKGDASQATDIVLYKTDLTPNDGKTFARIAIKGGGQREEGAVKSNLSLILHVNGAWKAYQVPDNKGKAWEEHTIELGLSTGDKIDYVGLRVEGGENNYDMLVGELEINDGNKVQPKMLKDVAFEKTRETNDQIDVKLSWDVDMEKGDYGLGYNSDANIDHFELLYKDGEDGKVAEVGRTSQWAAFVPNLTKGTKPMIGIVAMGKDLKTRTQPVWVEIETGTLSGGGEDPFAPYTASYLDEFSEGFANALRCRGVESVKTKNNPAGDYEYALSYEQFKADNKDGKADYLNFHKADNVLTVKQGTKFDLYVKGFDGGVVTNGATNDDCRYCFVGGWMDFDGSNSFNHGKGMKKQLLWKDIYANIEDGEENFQFDESTYDGEDPWGERVFRAGSLRRGNPSLVKNDGLHVTIEIPDDAHLGDSRLRIVYSDAWFAGAFGPSGKTNKGYTLDIPVKIIGDNVDNQRMPVDLHDQGTPDDWKVVTAIAQVNNAGEMSVKVMNGELHFQNTAKAAIYSVDGKLLKVVNNPAIVGGRALVDGIYIVKMQNGAATKSAKVIIK